jgi:hypothetical protein
MQAPDSLVRLLVNDRSVLSVAEMEEWHEHA